ncbi:MAG: hypothetical protein RSE51_10690, partial [Bacteroidales bacterium]
PYSPLKRPYLFTNIRAPFYRYVGMYDAVRGRVPFRTRASTAPSVRSSQSVHARLFIKGGAENHKTAFLKWWRKY